MRPAIEDLYDEHHTEADWYRLERWLDRVFAYALGWKPIPPGRRIPRGVTPRPPSDQHREIVASIDLSRVGHPERALMVRLLREMHSYRRALAQFPNLRGPSRP